MPFGRATDRRGTPSDFLVVGLGNPGREYERTRHNVGAEVVATLAIAGGSVLKAGKERALVAEVALGGARVALAFPTTYMNASGESVVKLIRRYGIDDPTQLLIVHDELDLPPGIVRVKEGGGLAGHNGLRSITQHLKSQDYLRIRIGVGKPPSKEHGANHVLSKISKTERELLDAAVVRSCEAVETVIRSGVATAMNEFNRA